MVNSYVHDTIAAIASAPGKAGISIVRVSGPNSIPIADSLFTGRKPSSMPAKSFAYGHIRQGNRGRILDEVILLVYRSPASYTTEDVVEIQTHGGAISAGRILEAIIQAGARPAECGEFTKRAFLNGRIDLVQAEAVADLIASKTERSAAAAMQQLRGLLSDRTTRLYEKTVSLAADMEASLDFDEYDIAPLSWSDIERMIRDIRTDFESLLETWHEGHLLRDGALVVICGRPNAGKSTLLNSLLGAQRAIVNETPGTTRDTVEEEFTLDGVPVRFVDTAGLRLSKCRIEQDGIRRAEDFVERADIVLYVLDASEGITAEDKTRLEKCGQNRTVIVANKIDLGNRVESRDAAKIPLVTCSLLDGNGIDNIKSAVSAKLKIADLPDDSVTISARHEAHVSRALDSVRQCEKLLADRREAQFVPAITYLRESAEEIGAMLGRTYHADMLESIFSRFCVGK